MSKKNEYLLDLGNRKIDHYGNVIIGLDVLEDAIAEGHDLSKYKIEKGPVIEYFVNTIKRFGFDNIIEFYQPPSDNVHDFHQQRSESWIIPDKYKHIDIKAYVLSRCKKNAERQRVEEEWHMYQERNLIPLLQWLHYMIVTFRENNVVMGVGRGSSVSSFILYLLGVHKINSLEWGLDPKEFLK